jgi:hypothetical protein
MGILLCAVAAVSAVISGPIVSNLVVDSGSCGADIAGQMIIPADDVCRQIGLSPNLSRPNSCGHVRQCTMASMDSGRMVLNDIDIVRCLFKGSSHEYGSIKSHTPDGISITIDLWPNVTNCDGIMRTYEFKPEENGTCIIITTAQMAAPPCMSLEPISGSTTSGESTSSSTSGGSTSGGSTSGSTSGGSTSGSTSGGSTSGSTGITGTNDESPASSLKWLAFTG